MYTVTDNVRTLLNSGAKQTAKIQITPASGETPITLTDADILSGGLEIDRYSQTGDEIQIGTSIAQELKLSLLLSEKLDGVALEGAEVFVQVGVEDTLTPRELLTENGLTLTSQAEERLEIEAFNTLPEDTPYTTVYIPMGYYIVDEAEHSANGIDITALDRMILFDQYVDPSVLTFPCTVGTLLIRICDAANVTLKDTSVSELTNADYVIDLPPTDENLTYRSLLNWIGQITGTCAFMDEEGLLRLQWFEDTNIELDEAVRYSSSLNERPITVTGVQVEDTAGNVVHDNGENYDPTYVLRIEGNHLIQSSAQSVADALGSKLRDFTYTPFEADTLPMPYLWIMDKLQFVRGGVKTPVILTNVNYVLNGATALAGKGKTETENKSAAPSAFTPEQTKINEWIRNETDRKIAETRNMSDYFSDIASTAMGMYKTVIPDENGGEKVYMHDAPLLEDSRYIATANSNGAFFTNSGWNNGDPQWIGGTDKNANALVSLLDAIGIKAEWIQADSITTDKLTIGMSERGTNAVLDSSFESNTTVEPATYDESGAITAPAHNTYWKAVTFHGGTTWDVTDSAGFPNIEPGGFDGNRAITDANLEGQDTGGTVWYMGVATMEPFAVTVTTHMLSFYLRALRWPHTVEQGTDTVHIQYAAKIHWLDAQKAELQTSVNTFDATNSTTDWQRVYTTVTPPNGAAFAELAIGYFCTDPPQDGQDPGTGEQGYYDVAFASLDGILLEAGTELDTWTCAPSEVNNVGVLMDSNGFRVEKGKFLVVDEQGTAYMYSDADQILTLVGGLISQLGNQRLYIKNGYVYFQFQNENGQWVNNGLIGIDGQTEPMYFSCNNGFKFNLARPLINDAQRIQANGSINSWLQPGWYYNESTAEAKTITGVPVGMAFILRVENCGNNIIQTWTSIEADICYKRYYQTWSPEGWQGWKKYSSDGVTKDAMWVDHFYPNQIFMDDVFSASSGGVTAQVELTTRGSPYGLYDTGGIYSTSDVRARDFINNSDRSTKENISEKADLQAVELIKALKFYSYDYIAEDSTPEAENAKKSAQNSLAQQTPIHMDLGIMADEAPQEIVSEDGKGISLYPYISLCAKAIQELTAKLEEQEQKISTLESLLEESDT